MPLGSAATLPTARPPSLGAPSANCMSLHPVRDVSLIKVEINIGSGR